MYAVHSLHSHLSQKHSSITHPSRLYLQNLLENNNRKNFHYKPFCLWESKPNLLIDDDPIDKQPNILQNMIETGRKFMFGDIESSTFDSLSDELQYFREYMKRGMNRMKDRNLDGALSDFNRALNMNTSMPIVQRGIVLYILGDYKAAEKQFDSDILLLESMKTEKASDLRLWRSACYNKMNQTADAKWAIDMYVPEQGLQEPRYLMNLTLGFYAGKRELFDVLEVIDRAEENKIDFVGAQFYGNFYLGLYFDSIYDYDSARSFLQYPLTSNRYSKRDMWYHIPRLLFESRFGNDTDSIK